MTPSDFLFPVLPSMFQGSQSKYREYLLEKVDPGARSEAVFLGRQSYLTSGPALEARSSPHKRMLAPFLNPQDRQKLKPGPHLIL